jgi:hypothetical protein
MDDLRPGDCVASSGSQCAYHAEIICVPPKGVWGILFRKEKRHRLVLGFRLIQQAAAEIDVNDMIAL